jgi:hypothetical protein
MRIGAVKQVVTRYLFNLQAYHVMDPDRMQSCTPNVEPYPVPYDASLTNANIEDRRVQ